MVFRMALAILDILSSNGCNYGLGMKVTREGTRKAYELNRSGKSLDNAGGGDWI